MKDELRHELETLREIAFLAKLPEAYGWIVERLEDDKEAEPDGVKYKVKWIRWYRSIHHVDLKVAIDEWNKRFLESLREVAYKETQR